MRQMGPEDRRARMARRHLLTSSARATEVAEVARALVGVHATDPATVFLAAAARMEEGSVEAIERALYVDRVVVRMLGMRRTMFIVPVDLVALVQAACTQAIAARERRRLVQRVEATGIAADGAAWLAAVEGDTARALAKGEATAAELSRDVPALREQILFGAATRWEGHQRAGPHVLFLLSADGSIVRGRPRGSWTSTQYRWAPMAAWLPAGVPRVSTAVARVELARRWLAAYGPGTSADLKWWTGWTAGEVRRALTEVDPVEVELDGSTGLVLLGDLDAVPPPEPEAVLLPALDPTIMGWSERAWFLGEHRPALFDRSGNPGPTVWWDGRVVGGWAQRRDGEIAIRLLEDVGADALGAVETAAGRLGRWLGPVRVTPRFRTPLERALTA